MGTPTEEREIERKFTVSEGVRVPAFRGWPGVAEVGPSRTFELRATYFDTSDLRLARHRITLRRRIGGGDDGWHLKRPHGPEGRMEHRMPLTDTEIPPQELLDAAQELREVVPGRVCEIDTHRVETDLLGPQGLRLAVCCDDGVVTRNLLDRSLDRQWSELEVELADGDMAFLDDATAYLESHGVGRASAASKLQTALGRLLDR